MTGALQFLNLVIAGIVLATTAGHALEFPGKMRLSKDEYLTTQQIYYPGFTYAGAAEPLAILTFALQAWLLHYNPVLFWPSLGAAISLIAVHAIYWFVTHPINNIWLKKVDLRAGGKTFFEINKSVDDADWRSLRARWEYSHIARAFFVLIAFLLLAFTAVVA